MKKKLISAVSALLVAGTVILSGCGEITTSFSANWYKNTSLSSNISGTSEKLSYKVEYNGDDKTNDAYTLNYEDGVYTTQLSNTVYKWEDGSSENVYSYSTSFNITVTYTINGESATYEDEVTSTVLFRTIEESLKPIRSVKTVSSHSPAMQSPKTLKEGVKYNHYRFTTEYNKAANEATLTSEKLDGDESSLKAETNVFEIDDKYTYIDNEQLLFAARGITSSSTTLYVLNASVKDVQAVTVSQQGTGESEYKFDIDGSETPEEGYKIPFTAVALQINGTQSGHTQTVYYASTTSADNNTYRNVMLYHATFLPYNLGYLRYTLTDAQFTNK